MTECRRCRATVAPGHGFCTACGAPVRSVREVVAAARSARSAAGRAPFALLCVLALPLLDDVLFAVDGAAGLLLDAAWTFGILVLAVVVLGVDEIGAAVPFPATAARPRWLLAAVPTAVVTLAVAFGWVALLRVVLPDALSAYLDVSALLVFAVVVMAPVGEEALCRGVAWHAVGKLLGPGRALVPTALLFAFLHLLNGLSWLELPHRFAMGLALGWLRLRSGGLWAPILAHALHNAVAVCW